MALCSSNIPKTFSFSGSILILLFASLHYVSGCSYTSIFAFGDSLTDTGNYVNMYSHLFPGNQSRLPRYALSPYGDTYFHYPTGRCSDGRLIVDFMAEYYGLPFTPPYSKGVNESETSFEAGANFAVLGAPALEVAFYEGRGIHYTTSNVSMSTQLSWFKELLPSLCKSSSCTNFLKSSLFLMGPFGGDDYGHAFFQGRSLEEVKSFVPLVIKDIGSALKELIKLGVKNIIVPGLLPDGCLPVTLTLLGSKKKEDYDPATGCLNWLNHFSQFHNRRLKKELHRIRRSHPDAVIVYADYFNALMPLYRSPQQYGFGGGPLVACCGTRGPYNFNYTAQCGEPPSTPCADPSSHVSWDGAHCTEAAYRFITLGLLEGPYATPPIKTTCISTIVNTWGHRHSAI